MDQVPLGTEIGLSPAHIVLDWDPAPAPRPRKGHGSPHFSAHVCCGQTAGWIKMPLDVQVGLGPGHIVLDGDPAPLQKGSPQFLVHVCCGQTAGWIKMPLFNWYGGRPRSRRHCVRWGTQSPLKRDTAPRFSAHVYCGQTVAHLSYC